jgi:ATP-binding cassette subfamily F protein 3
MEPGDKLGLIGRNGTGKTTLFRIITGEEGIDSGKIVFPRNYRISYLTQELKISAPTVLEAGCEGLPPEEKHDHYKVEKILFGLGFTEEDMRRSPHELAGGFQVRLALAKTLVSEPNLLLLDEPTNYLDIVAIRWITRFLRTWKNEVIIISHDREFLDNVTTHTAIIHRNKILKVKGGTSKLETLVEEQDLLYEKQRESEEKLKKELQTFIDKTHGNPATATQARSRRRMLERIEDREKLKTLYNLDFDFRYKEFPGKIMMEVQNLSFHYEKDKPLIRNLSFYVHNGDRIAVIGKNGKGKSTLLNLLGGELSPVEGTIKPSINTQAAFFGQTNIERLQPDLTVEEEIWNSNPNLQRTEVRGICGVMMFPGGNALKKVSVLSGGEKSRVMLGKIISTPANLVLLDEPTNHLDVQSVEALVDAIERFAGAVIIVTHDEMILRRVAKKLLVFQHGSVDLFHGGYDDFLRRVGWEEEADLKKKETQPKASVKSKKEIRQLRGQIMNEKSKVLKPLVEKIDALEEKICRMEEELDKVTAELQKANENQDAGSIAVLSKQMHDLKKKIDSSFAELEKTVRIHAGKSAHYEDLLNKAG